MKIAQAAEQSGLSAHTIRYYEQAGMLPEIDRGSDGYRRFTPRMVDWLILLASLRETGMPMAQMKAFAALYRQGDDTVTARKAVLQAHSDHLDLEQAKLDACRALLMRKVAMYDAMLGDTS